MRRDRQGVRSFNEPRPKEAVMRRDRQGVRSFNEPRPKEAVMRRDRQGVRSVVWGKSGWGRAMPCRLVLGVGAAADRWLVRGKAMPCQLVVGVGQGHAVPTWPQNRARQQAIPPSFI